MKRWKLNFESATGFQRELPSRISNSLRLSQFIESPKASSARNHFGKSAFDQAIQITSRARILRISFPNSIHKILSGINVIWQSSDYDKILNYEIYVKDTEFPLSFNLLNGSKIDIDCESASWISALKSRPLALTALVIFAFHLLLLGLTRLDIKFEKSRETEIVDLSKIQVSLAYAPATTRSRTARISSQNSFSDQLLQGFRLKSTELKSTGRKFVAEDEFPKSKRAASKNLFDYGEAQSNVISDQPINVNAQQIAEALRPYQSRLKECYDEALFIDASLTGRAQLMIRARASGRMDSLQISGLEGTAAARDAIQSCFQRVLSGANLPSASQDFAISQSLILYR